MRFSNMPGWTRSLMSERKFRKAVIRAAKFDTMKILAQWDKGNSWCGWENGPGTGYEWRPIPMNGMYDQMDAHVSVSGETHCPPSGEGSARNSVCFRTADVARICFWDWNAEVA